MKIPIQNIYYLLCYAWNKLKEKDVVSVGVNNKEEVLDLFARILCTGISHLLTKGIDRGYVLYSEETYRIRGKVNFPLTLKKNFMIQPRIYCEFDELSHNILHNQILKATIKRLIRCEDLGSSNRDELRNIYHRFHAIDDINLNNRHFRRVQLNRNNRFYDFLLRICELIIDNLQITEDGDKSKFKDFFQDEKAMAILFEEFIRNFYKKEQTTYKVKRENI